MKKKLICLFFQLAIFSQVQANGIWDKTAPEEIFQAANVDFLGGRFEDAIRKYESLIQAKQLTPAVFYNLANAYARQGATGHAMVNYQRALYLSPRDPDVRANLAFTAKREQIALPAVPWYLTYTTFLTPNAWFMGSLIFTFLASLTGIILCLKINLPSLLRKKRIPLSALVGAIFFLVSGTIALQRFQYAVVTKPDTALTLSPVPDAQLVAVLPNGHFVRPIKSYRDYLLVETPNHQRGWLPKSSLESILPNR